jgi:phosphoenolpyruvate synthase/pyruvate phosphate dikinase
MKRVNALRNLLDDYFYTEFFFVERIKSNDKDTIKNLELMGKLKYKARKVLNRYYNHNDVFSNFLKEISKQKKIKDLEWLCYEEIILLLENKFIFNKEVILNRKFKNWILRKNNNWLFELDKNNLLKDFDNYFSNKNLNEVSGIIANKGIYKGKVKVLKTIFSSRINDELKKFNQGDVLVAETTGPEMMIACEKAGAIVTDQGGLTSHAAIVSRELKIPCIIGTKIATKVFKDNDLVEVDADNGIVRKLK